MNLYKVKTKRFLWSDDEINSIIIGDVNVNEIVVLLSKSIERDDMIKVLTKQQVGFIYDHSLKKI